MGPRCRGRVGSTGHTMPRHLRPHKRFQLLCHQANNLVQSGWIEEERGHRQAITRHLFFEGEAPGTPGPGQGWGLRAGPSTPPNLARRPLGATRIDSGRSVRRRQLEKLHVAKPGPERAGASNPKRYTAGIRDPELGERCFLISNLNPKSYVVRREELGAKLETLRAKLSAGAELSAQAQLSAECHFPALPQRQSEVEAALNPAESCSTTPTAVRLRHATSTILHQRHLGRLL